MGGFFLVKNFWVEEIGWGMIILKMPVKKRRTEAGQEDFLNLVPTVPSVPKGRGEDGKTKSKGGPAKTTEEERLRMHHNQTHVRLPGVPGATTTKEE